MLDRVSRAMMLSGTSASVIAGSTRCTRRSVRPPLPVGEYMPAPGSQPKCTEKVIINSRPTQKAGMLTPSIAAAVISRSTGVPCRAAATIPTSVPSGKASSTPPAVRMSVAENRRTSSGKTARCCMMERPKSPRRTWDAQRRY